MSLEYSVVNFTVPLNNTAPNTLDLRGWAIAGVAIPASMAGTSLTFEVSINDSINSVGNTFVPLKDETNAVVTVPISNTAAYYNLINILPIGIGGLKITSGSASDDGKIITVRAQRVI